MVTIQVKCRFCTQTKPGRNMVQVLLVYLVSGALIAKKASYSITLMKHVNWESERENSRWLWYAREPPLKRIITHAFSKRNTDALRSLLALLKPFGISFFYDDFSVYSKVLPRAKHLVGKRLTQRIKRTYLTYDPSLPFCH